MVQSTSILRWSFKNTFGILEMKKYYEDINLEFKSLIANIDDSDKKVKEKEIYSFRN